MNITEPLTSTQGTARWLEGFLDVNVDGDTFTVSFESEDAALAAVEAAKAKRVSDYLRGGGNPRNKRSFGAQFAAVKKAITKAAQS